MSSGYSGSDPDFNMPGGFGRRSVSFCNPQVQYRPPQLNGILIDPVSQMAQRGSDLIGKRSLTEYQVHHQQQRNSLFQFQQQQLHPRPQPQPPQDHKFSHYLRNVKQRIFHQPSPLSPLSGFPILQPLRPQPMSLGYGHALGIGNRNGIGNGNGVILPSYNPSMPSASYQSLVPIPEAVSERKMMTRLQELEKQLLDDVDDEGADCGSVITNSEWAETMKNLLTPTTQIVISSSSPTSSSSSCSSPPIVCPKQALMEVASAISEGKKEVAMEILIRLNQIANALGSPEQRLTAYMTSALRSRLNPREYPPPVNELYGQEHSVSTQMLYQGSPCFNLGFIAANLAILEAISEHPSGKLHVLDFEIGHGSQYVHLIQSLAAVSKKPMSLKLTTFIDVGFDSEERLRGIGDMIKADADKAGIFFNLEFRNWKTFRTHEDEVFAVNFAFRLFKLPDESVTMENLRDDLLRRVKRLSPTVVTVVEQEMNTNTATFVGRVAEVLAHYGALMESLHATVPNRDQLDRVRVEEGLGRRVCNSVACEGMDRRERCEVLGKWTARMNMAGFKGRALSQEIYESLKNRVDSETRVNPGFTVKEEKGSICFGWKGRTLTVASAWF